jgi:hypothetical protein
MTMMHPGRAWLGGALLLGLTFASSAAWADELPKFTGYTRPGVPTAPPGAIKMESGKGGPLGATVYFKVFELSNLDESDPWGTGLTNLDRLFVPGQASRGRNAEKLDTSARYLYLYQVVNDSYREGQVKSVAVRILVPPHLITSWGHFAEKKGKGVGFSMVFDNPDPKNAKAKNLTLPVSTTHAGVTDDIYRDPAPYFAPPKPYGLTRIQLNNKPAPLTDGEDPGREPERVVLQAMYNFEGAPNWLEKDRVTLPSAPGARLALPNGNLGNPYYNPASPLMQMGMGSLGTSAASLSEALRRAPAVVAYWEDEPLLPAVNANRPGQRSTVFGFTTNFPPVYEDVRVRGNVAAAVKAPEAPAADTSVANLRADGEVPTPVALEQAIPRLGHALGGLGGPIGQVTAGGGLLRGGGFGMGGGGFGMIGGFGGGLGGFGMGGFGGGSSGNGNGSSSQQQPQNQNQAQTLFPFPLGTQPVNVSVQQSQSMSQSQNQSQSQSQSQSQNQSQSQKPGDGGHHGQVVPEPAAVISALLGVPAALLLLRRRRAAATPAD